MQAAANAMARVLTLAEVVERELRFTTTVDYTVTRGELRHVRLRLRDWEEENVEIQAERVALRSGPRRVMGERSWQLPLQPGVRGHYQVTLHGSMPLDKVGAGVPMPEVLVQGVEHADYFLAVAGSELTGQANGSLQLLKSPRQALQSVWPKAAQQLERSKGQAWHIDGSEWQVRLQPQMRVLQPTSVRVHLLERWTRVVDGRRWLHEARCWLHQEGQADLALDFPAPARVLAATVDGVEVTPLPSGSTRLWLPLPGRPGVRCLCLRWLYEQPELLDHPNLISPQLLGARNGPTLWTVMVPPGWHPTLTSVSGWQGATREAALELWRASVQLRISQDLAKQQQDSIVSAALAASEQRFELYCRHARQALDQGADEASVAGPQEQSLSSWFEHLQAVDRSINGKMRNAKSKNPQPNSDFGLRFSDFDESSGIPLSWQELPGEEPPALRLTPRQSQQTRYALSASAQWLGILVLVGLFSAFPFMLARLRLFWPEQIALLGLIGWHLAGLTSIVLGLLLVAVSARVFLLIRWLNTFVRQRFRQTSATPANNGATS